MADLLELPDVVMKNISNKLDVKTLLKLRKVNKALRSYVDDEKPDFQVGTLCVVAGVEISVIELHKNLDEFINISYKAIDESTTSVYEMKKQERIIDGINYMKAFNSDVEILLKNQKPASKPISLNISIDYYDKNFVVANDNKVNLLIETFLTELKQILTSRAQVIRIDSLSIEVRDQKHVMLVLPFLLPETLASLRLTNAFKARDERTLELNEIVQTEQWKNIQELHVEGLFVIASLRDFAHISRLEVNIMTVTPEDLIFLKEAFMTMATPKDHTYYYEKFEDKEKLDTVFGPSINASEAGSKKQWEFDIPENKEKVVIIELSISQFIEIRFCDKSAN